jgi:hypothetical protein
MGTKIKDAELGVKQDHKYFEVTDPEEVSYEMLGEKDAPPLEMTDDLLEELTAEEKLKEEAQEETRSQTQHYTNGVNEWVLIAKTYNNILAYEHVTTAMEVAGGCLVCVKEAIGQKMHSTVTFVPGIRLTEQKEQFYLTKI